MFRSHSVRLYLLLRYISKEKQFDNLTEAADYIIKNNYSKAKKIEAVKQNISKCLREIVYSTGVYKNTIKKAFKHNWIIINKI